MTEAFFARVWRQFAENNGFLLSAGMGYFILFALFALIYVVFAVIGVWLGGSETAITAVIDIIDSYVPGLIGDPGVFSTNDVADIARDASGVLSVTGGVAIAVGIWTAISAVTYTRRAVRDIFGLPFDDRGFLTLKLYDFFGAILFGGSLLLGAALSTIGVWALTQVFDILGWSTESGFFSVGVRVLSILVAFVIDAAALIGLVRFLTGTSIPWRVILPGSLAGAGAMVVLQLALGLLLSRAPGNPLLATFAVIIGVLLWCRWLSIVVLIAASWIAVSADDRDHPLTEADEQTSRLAEREALQLAAKVELREAEEYARKAAWYRRRGARKAVDAAKERLERATEELDAERANRPVPTKSRSLWE